jgi:hypothetical protein
MQVKQGGITCLHPPREEELDGRIEVLGHTNHDGCVKHPEDVVQEEACGSIWGGWVWGWRGASGCRSQRHCSRDRATDPHARIRSGARLPNWTACEPGRCMPVAHQPALLACLLLTSCLHPTHRTAG